MIRGQQSPLPFFEPQSDWTPPDLSSLPSWDGARRVAVDTETRDPELSNKGPGVRRKDCYVVGYSVAIEDGPQFYVPLRHGGGGNVDVAQGLNYLRHEASKFKGDICGAGLQYDIDFLSQEDISFPNVRFFRDVQVAAPLIDELQMSYSLENIAQREGIPGKDESVLMEALASYGFQEPHAKRGLHVLPSRLVGPYGEQDARLPLQLLSKLEREIDAQELWGVYDLESRVLPILVRMRQRGVRVSFERLEAVERWSRDEQAKALSEVKRLTGITLLPPEVTRPEALASVLRAIGIEPPRTAKTGKVSITKDLLAGIDHPVGKLLRRARQMSQLRSTFCNAIRTHAIFSADGDARIHCTFNQLRRSKEDEGGEGEEGAAFGRLSCSNPNLQQQPARDPEIGPMWRAIYLPEKGAIWGALDYSQQEPRMAVHFAVRSGPKFIGREAHNAALRAQAQYRSDPKTDFHDLMTRMVYGADVYERVGAKEFKKLRTFCKEIYLGLSYGMGGAKLCRKLGLPTKIVENKRGELVEVAGDEGQSIIDRFNQEVPFIRQTAWVAQQRAKGVGFITTVAGRRCHFPKDQFGNYDWCHKGFNRLIQGSSADQTKTALVELDKTDAFYQLQVHDEIDGSFGDVAEAQRAAKVMEECMELEVPFRVDVECGPSWGEAA